MNIVDHATLTVSSTSVGLSSASVTLATAIAAGAKGAQIIVEDDSVYCRQDGDAATSADTILYQQDCINMIGEDFTQPLANLRFLRVTTDATLQVIYYE